jgi:hypothetical protein
MRRQVPLKEPSHASSRMRGILQPGLQADFAEARPSLEAEPWRLFDNDSAELQNDDDCAIQWGSRT